MRWQRRFLQKFEKVAIPNITGYWVALQAAAMFMIWGRPDFANQLLLDTQKVMAGEWWRIFTFLFTPVSLSPIFSLFVLYFYWMMGSALEMNWGTARYNLYLLIGAVMNIGAAFLPVLAGRNGSGSNYYLMESVFLGFATLYPDFVIRIFFIIPVRIKWLALLTWILLAFQFGAAGVMADFTGMAMVVASIFNYLLFFRVEIVERIKMGHKQMHRQVRKVARGPAVVAGAMHRCVACGATERSAPQLEFRYCTTCGGKCYCLEHLRTHACVTDAVLK